MLSVKDERLEGKTLHFFQAEAGWHVKLERVWK